MAYWLLSLLYLLLAGSSAIEAAEEMAGSPPTRWEYSSS